MRFELTILGSNSAVPAHGRHPSAQVLNAHDAAFLIDCGEGTQMQMARFQIKRSKIKAIFISHLHGDHFFGLIGLLTTMSLGGHQKPISVFSPPGLQEIIEKQLEVSKTVLSFPIRFFELHPKGLHRIYDSEQVEVYSFPLIHRIQVSGFLFKEKPALRSIIPQKIVEYNIPFYQIPSIKEGKDFVLPSGAVIPNQELTQAPAVPRSFAYCSDTRFTESILPYIYGVDLLYHEATFTSANLAQAEKTMHTTSEEAALIAQKAKVKNLVIGHFSSRYVQLDDLLHEARNIFHNTALAREGQVFPV